MKRKIFYLAIVAAVLSLSAAVFAQEELKIRGEVKKIDTASASVTIQPKEGAPVTVVMANAGMLSRVKEGDKAEVKYVVKDGVNTGVRLRKLVEGCN
ncbi:MAG TPA: hypothetical protein VF903_08795 [Nitrospirota bacterium]